MKTYYSESSAFTTFKLLQDEILPVTHLLKSQYDVIALLSQIHGDSQERFFHKTKQNKNKKQNKQKHNKTTQNKKQKQNKTKTKQTKT